MYNSRQSENTYIKILYSPGFSMLRMSYYKTNLILNFIPSIDKDYQGVIGYNKNSFLSTSINPEKAAFFYMQTSRIIDGIDSEKSIETVLPCNNGTTLTFEYKPDEDNQMRTYLTINKNNMTIPFRFPVIEYYENVDGQTIKTVMQAGLVTFSLILGCYLAGSAVDGPLNKHNELYNEALESIHEETLQDQQAIDMISGNINQGFVY